MTPVTPLHPSSKRFYLSKGRVQPILLALVELQQRTDLSGKFARKLSRIRRVLAPVDEGIVVEVQVIEGRFTRRDAEGKALPVFQKNAAGQVVFEKDGEGRDTDVPVVLANQFHITDLAAYNAEMLELHAERVTVDCESFAESEFDAFKAVRGVVIDALMDLGEDSEFTKIPAIEALIADSSESSSSLSAPTGAEGSEEGRTAP
jgi:hypothetical protein